MVGAESAHESGVRKFFFRLLPFLFLLYYIAFLDRANIDMQVLVPGNECFQYDVEPDLATSVCQSYNSAARQAVQGCMP